MRLLTATHALGGIACLDLIATLTLLHYGAEEANPLMASFLAHGVASFIAAKLMLIAIPLAILKYAARRRPTFVRRAVIVGIAAYISLFLAGVALSNLRLQPTSDPKVEDLRQRLWADSERRIAEQRRLARRPAVGAPN